MRFSALFGEVFGQTALSSLTFERGEDARNGAYGLPFISGTIISDHLQMS